MKAEPVHGLDLRTRLLIAIGLIVFRVLAVTWRLRLRDREVVTTLRGTRSPIIFTFWHGQLLPLLWVHRREGAAVLISEHRDGEIVARVGNALGFRMIRGSSSRGGGRALIGVVKELNAGGEVAITPDGPRGPARRFAPGALIAAHRSGAPIVGVSVSADRQWRLRSWDSFMIPKPFARVTVAYSGPWPVRADSPRQAAELTSEYEEMLERTARAAES
jgi:lysophospholipid acyltransferase (LPLAT)-like uncharacterized protein